MAHTPHGTGQCIVDWCERVILARGLCGSHYKRLLRYGDPTGSPKRRTPEERFALNTRKTESCWEWTGTILKTGYGKFVIKKKQYLAHRIAYEMAYGEIPDGLVIDHLCRNRKCVNPEHLEAVTNEENLRRGAGYAIANGMRDSCIHGHKYTPENIYRSPGRGEIRCRTCARIADRKRNRTKKVAA